MIPSNVMNRVIHIGSGDHQATGTMIHVDDREYLVTARHFADTITDRIDISHNGTWIENEVRLIGHSDSYDISVISLNYAIIPKDLHVNLTLEGMMYSEDVYFLGFPFGMSCRGGAITADYPIPFVKRATVANFASQEFGADFWLDGHNNVGFSGGPVVSTVQGEPENCSIRGFICGYFSHPEDVEGDFEEKKFTYMANSGLIIAAGVHRALKIIQSNPIGAQL